MDAIRQVKEAVGDSVVIVSNGNVRNCGEADDALELLSPSSEIDLGTVLERLAAMEKQLAPSLKARALDVAALSPRKVTPTKKGLVSP